MGRSTKKQADEIEVLKTENKELKSQNKALSQKLKKESKKYHPSQTSDSLEEEEYEEKTTCKNCGKGKIKVMELGPVKFKICSVGCGYKEKINGKEKEEESSS